jgi:hypothetical protein
MPSVLHKTLCVHHRLHDRSLKPLQGGVQLVVYAPEPPRRRNRLYRQRAKRAGTMIDHLMLGGRSSTKVRHHLDLQSDTKPSPRLPPAIMSGVVVSKERLARGKQRAGDKDCRKKKENCWRSEMHRVVNCPPHGLGVLQRKQVFFDANTLASQLGHVQSPGRTSRPGGGPPPPIPPIGGAPGLNV